MPKSASFIQRPRLWSFSRRSDPRPVTAGLDPNRIRIASPCTASWEAMKGDDQVRHCTECNLNVYNFSAMSWKEVERLIAGHQGRLCARLYRRADGTIMTQDCPKGLQAVVRRISRWAGAALSAMTMVNFAGAQSPSGKESQPLVQIKNSAQTAGQESATVAVQVVDAEGAVIPGAAVKLVNQVSGQSWEATADRDGRVRLSVPGRNGYKVILSAKGFATSQQDLNPLSLKGEETKLKLKVAMMGVVVDVTPVPVATAEVPFQSNLRPIPEPPAPAPPKKKHKRWFHRHGSKTSSVQSDSSVSTTFHPSDR